MKRFFYTVVGMLVVLSVQVAGRARAVRNDVGDRLDGFDVKGIAKQVSRLSLNPGRLNTGALHDQLDALSSTAEEMRDKKLRKNVQKLQKSLAAMDTKAIVKQADKVSERLSGPLAKATGGRVQPPRRRRRFPILALLLLGGAVGAGVLAARRREQLAQQLGGLQDGARGRLPGVVDGLRSRGGATTRPNEQELRASVEQAIHAAAPAIATDLQIEVEGRTVYLRGATTDRELLESAVRRAQDVPGVAAVINLVSMTAPAGSNNSGSSTAAATATS